jgi:3',5'-cyclic AMP phosphodiesterase CpdA
MQRLGPLVLLTLTSGLAVPAAQPGAPVSGLVFLDANANGTREAGETGLAGVAVSNQRDVVRTDAGGRYALPGPGTGVVFVSVPDRHRSIGPFWRPASDGARDFALAEVAGRDSLTFLHASDPHTSAESLPRLQRVRAIVEARRPDFVLMTGDLVKDALRVGEAEASGYYAQYVDEIARWPVPVWSVPGNHENFGIERHQSLVSPRHPLYAKGMYRARLGPTYYSFTAAGVHFVGLDTVDIDDLWYYGHVDAGQLAWLRADLAAVPAGTPVVTFNHIPFVSASEVVKGFTEEGVAPTTLRVGGREIFRHTVANFADVLAILGARPWPIALAGHVHVREQIRYGSSVATRFHQAAAIVGPTSGPVPATSGVTLYRVTGGQVDDGEFIPLP